MIQAGPGRPGQAWPGLAAAGRPESPDPHTRNGMGKRSVRAPARLPAHPPAPARKNILRAHMGAAQLVDARTSRSRVGLV